MRSGRCGLTGELRSASTVYCLSMRDEVDIVDTPDDISQSHALDHTLRSIRTVELFIKVVWVQFDGAFAKFRILQVCVLMTVTIYLPSS